MDDAHLTTAEGTESAYAVFTVGATWLAVPAERAVRFLELPAITQLPLAQPAVLGVCIASGRPLAVVDLALVLGLERGQAASPRLLVVSTRGGVVGLATEAIAGLELVAATEVRAFGQDGRGFTVGTFTTAGRHVTVLDVERLVDSIERAGSGH